MREQESVRDKRERAVQWIKEVAGGGGEAGGRGKGGASFTSLHAAV